MHIIARFPRLPPVDDAAVDMPCEPAENRPRREAGPRWGRPSVAGALAGRHPAFPTVSVATLAAVAAVAWSLAAWHESVRLASQQRPERLALQPAAVSRPATSTLTP